MKNPEVASTPGMRQFESKNVKGHTIMGRKELIDKISIYIPQPKMGKKPVERLIKLGRKKDRSVNYLVVEAILEYLDREEKS